VCASICRASALVGTLAESGARSLLRTIRARAVKWPSPENSEDGECPSRRPRAVAEPRCWGESSSPLAPRGRSVSRSWGMLGALGRTETREAHDCGS